MTYEKLIVNDNIKLEQLKLSEAEVFFGLIDNDREYLSRFLPWPNETKSVDDSTDFIERMIKLRASGEEYGFAIKYDNEIIGHVSLMHLKEGRAEIGYWIVSSRSGKGIVTTVVSAFTDFAHNTLDLKEIDILANPKNIGSNRVAEKNGYKLNGTIERDGEELNKWVLVRQ